MSIKIGNLDVSYFKVGGADCSICLGSEKLYPTTPSSFKYKLALSDSTTVSAECDATSAITQAEISAYTSTLVSAEIGDCVNELSSNTFNGCSSLSAVTIPNNVTTIGFNAFRYCYSLTSVTIPSGVTSIGGNTFQGCSSLTSIDIPNGVTAIDTNAFNLCTGLTSCTIGSGVTTIGDSAFKSCRSLTSVTIPNTVTTIGREAFAMCSGLTSIDIPDSVTSISNSAFTNCSSITSVTIGSGITNIFRGVFNNCSSLISIDIPNSVTAIGLFAFNGCTSLTAITVNATTPPSLSNSNAFTNTNNCPIYVPSGSVNAYKTATNWSTYADRIQAIPHDYSEDYLTFRALEDGTFSFNGTGAVSANTLEYSVDSGSTWSTLQNGGTTPTVTSGNTILWKASGLTIGSGGIGKFSSTGQFEAEGNIMSLHFGDNFSGQTSLSGMNYAFNSLFFKCTSITSAENLVLPATTLATQCYQQMFNGCSGLTESPILPAETLKTQSYNAMFFGCTSLSAITCLATDITKGGCTQGWVDGVAANGTFTKAASMSSWTEGTSGIPSGWTVVDYSG